MEISLPKRTHLSRKEASQFTGFSEQTLAKWATLGRGPKFTKLGDGRCSRVRYSVEDLRAFLNGEELSACQKGAVK